MVTTKSIGAVGGRVTTAIRDTELHEGSTQGVPEKVDLEYFNCPMCNQPAKEVIAAAAHIRRGWYCVPCKHFVKAYLRERKL